MSIRLKVYDNGDHTCLVWLPDDGKPIPDCRGFSIRRVSKGQQTYLHGFVGFSDTDKIDPKNPWKFPVQRFMCGITPSGPAIPCSIPSSPWWGPARTSSRSTPATPAR